MKTRTHRTLRTAVMTVLPAVAILTGLTAISHPAACDHHASACVVRADGGTGNG
ncbi:hypothetical protein POF50_015110 [Streptomyces sp. SL13]|uniref:Secreted protein n=1 Tax=Streptantibioticus silvisoli TaxID=2705255 RepID=A0AA90H252_9ACTN|nr:hypothetical protein [Streptantibioticus silvisoli]MDI5962226.1 hypothetical protein [Streptantibioticus silvisoli]MDI5970656.1 hypothetical protein [Streptantibioticus silvisoli]